MSRYNVQSKESLKNVQDILLKGQDLLSVPEHWCQKDFAQDEEGRSTGSRSASAVRFCAVGALYHVVPEEEEPKGYVYNAESYLQRSASSLYCRGVVDTNDGENQEEAYQKVKAIYHHAVEMVGKDLQERETVQ